MQSSYESRIWQYETIFYSSLQAGWLCECEMVLAVLFLSVLISFVLFVILFLSAGLDAELYYVRDDVVNHYALSFILPVPSDTNSLHFTWQSSSKVGTVHVSYAH